MTKSLSLIVSVYNEQAALRDFYKVSKSYLEELNTEYEIIFVNDGSTDKSLDILKEFVQTDQNVKVIVFSKNFGHEAAMIAGIDYAKNDILICMDADLQHPPALIKDILNKFNEGYDIVNMLRTKNLDAGIIKNICSSLFYSSVNVFSNINLEKNASDFFAISSKVAQVFKYNYREKIRFLRAYVQNIGFKTYNLRYEADKRVAGKSKYSLKKLLSFSMDSILCFSDLPLKLSLYAGIFSIFIGLILSIYTIYIWANYQTPSGYTTIVILLCFMFAILFFILAIIGKYISIIFIELKNRPIYIIDEILDNK